MDGHPGYGVSSSESEDEFSDGEDESPRKSTNKDDVFGIFSKPVTTDRTQTRDHDLPAQVRFQSLDPQDLHIITRVDSADPDERNLPDVPENALESGVAAKGSSFGSVMEATRKGVASALFKKKPSSSSNQSATEETIHVKKWDTETADASHADKLKKWRLRKSFNKKFVGESASEREERAYGMFLEQETEDICSELPRCIENDMLEEATLVLQRTVKEYKKHLGKRNNLTKEATAQLKQITKKISQRTIQKEKVHH